MPTWPETRSDTPAPKGLGQVEYRLARDSVVREFRRGRLSRIEICDAHPELLRVARHLGKPTEVDCPICEAAKLVHVAFAFGPRLPPGGRALTMNGDLHDLARRRDDVSFYIVEVCADCSWNHLLRSFSSARARLRPVASPARRGGPAPG